MRLTEPQRRAVQSWQRGDICVIAGPGSGKTRVLVERVRWLVLERSVEPERILAITFTEKAALEMHARLVSEASGTEGVRDRLAAVHVSTIDAFCNRLLREHAPLAGVDPGFEMLDPGDARKLLEDAVGDTLDWAFRKSDPRLGKFLAAYAASPSRQRADEVGAIQDDLAALVAQVRSHGRRPFLGSPRPTGPARELATALMELARAKDAPGLLATVSELSETARLDPSKLAPLVARAQGEVSGYHKRGKLKPLVARVKDDLLPACLTAAASSSNRAARAWLLAAARRTLRQFSAAKHASGRMDFDDTLAMAAELLCSENAPQLAYEHVLIDEFQDTNPLQIGLIEGLLQAHGPQRPVRFVAGDINQSIYGFRHAVREVFQNYRERVEQAGGEVVELLDNFRSRPEILAAVHRVLPGGQGRGIDRHRLQAAGRFPPKREPCVELLVAEKAGPGPASHEGTALAERLRTLRGSLQVADRTNPGGARPMRWGDAAVLARTHATASAIAQAFRREGIPCVASASRGLFAAPVTAELAAFLRALRNPRDEISLAAVLKSPFCAISDSALLQLRMAHQNLADALRPDADWGGLDPATASRLERFRARFDLCREDRGIVPARQLLVRAMADCGYRSLLETTEDGDMAAARVDQMLDWIGLQHARGVLDLDAVSATLDRALQEQPPTEFAQAASEPDSVQVLTMHAAKGLEFPVVALVSLQRRVWRHRPGMLFSGTHGIGARWTSSDGDRRPDAAYARIDADLRRREDHEEERLLYVAMTRAEEHLILSASFAGMPQMSGWMRGIASGLGVKLRSQSSGELEDRTAGDLRFLYRKTTGPLTRTAAGRGPVPARRGDLLRPREATAQADYAAAVTSVALFAECPRKYYLSRQLGLASEDWGSQAGRAHGRPQPGAKTRRGTPSPSELGTQVHEFLAGETEGATPAVRKLARHFDRHELGRRAASAWSAEREAAFVFSIGSHVLRGTIDLLFEDSHGRVLVDYKTDRRSRSHLDQAALEHATQLQLYAAGLDNAGRAADRAVVFYLRPGVAVDIDIGTAALASAKEQVGRFFSAQSAQSFPLREGPRCRHCPHFRNACPAGS